MIIKFYLFPFVICRRVTSPKTYMRGVGRGGAEQCEIVRRTFASRRIYFICGTAILLMRAPHTHTPHSKSLSTSSLSGDFYSARRTAKKITLIQGIFSFFMSTIVLSPPLRARARYNMKRTICVRKGGGRWGGVCGKRIGKCFVFCVCDARGRTWKCSSGRKYVCVCVRFYVWHKNKLLIYI